MPENWTETRLGRVAVFTFTRPPKNWMNILSMTELVGHLERLAKQSDEVTVVMLTGGIDEYFIAHADLDALAKLARGEDVGGDLGAWVDALSLLESMPQPTVAAIDGQGLGWRLRNRAGLYAPNRFRKGASGPARSQCRHHSRRRWHATTASTGRQRHRNGTLSERTRRRRGRSAPDRAAQRGPAA